MYVSFFSATPEDNRLKQAVETLRLCSVPWIHCTYIAYKMVFGAEAIDNRFECTCSIAVYCFLSIRSWLIYNLYACTRIQLEDRHRYICFGEYVQFYILHRSRMYLTEILMLFIEYFSVVRRTFYRVYPLELYVIG